ncbi:hypothetical protein CENSYa_1091 [Cenarchaeum symbiosum A]|uniref:Uncharacterized protein n=1 Tax=Cenarchaeum symbiosum (strain A) TaxID=414004 RepID=A0RWK3_CENSY|nr:hypothetical protein CENSYa_1091 [Cenarchaeum symbiosum A]
MAAEMLTGDGALISEHMTGVAAIAASNARLSGELRKYDNENTPRCLLIGDGAWARVYVALYITMIDMTCSRSSLVPLQCLPLYMMIVSDGYDVYLRFRVRQR